MKETLKKIWKYLFSIILKIYVGNYALIVKNYVPTNAVRNFHSQFGQDVFVLEHIFKNKNDGFFVDIGANHPTHCSNTYALEVFGWKGIAIEPQEKLCSLWPTTRKTPCFNVAIGEENKTIRFLEGSENEHGLSGVEGYNKISKDYRQINVEQKKLSDILQQHSITTIDYLSIDVEGYEMNVLKSINFKDTHIKLIGIENDLGFKWLPFIGKKLGAELGDSRIRNFLKEKGYTYIARIICDDFFIKK